MQDRPAQVNYEYGSSSGTTTTNTNNNNNNINNQFSQEQSMQPTPTALAAPNAPAISIASSIHGPPSAQSSNPLGNNGQKATPRMLRSVSGTLRSKSDLLNTSANDIDNHMKLDSSPNYTAADVESHKRRSSLRLDNFVRSNSLASKHMQPEDKTRKIEVPRAAPGTQGQGPSQLLPPLPVPSPASTPLGVVQSSSQNQNQSINFKHTHRSGTEDPLAANKALQIPGSHQHSQNLQQQQQQQQSNQHQSQIAGQSSHQHPVQQGQQMPASSRSQPQQTNHSPHHHQQHQQRPASALQTNSQHSQQAQAQAQQPQQQPPQQQQQQQFHRKSIGDWDFVKTIGAGSMGKVKLAQHNTTKEICAVKIIPRASKLYQRAHANDPPPQTAQEAAQRHKEFEKELARDKRTIREGALGRLLFHPFICRLYEMVPMTNHYYMLFEYIEGGQMLDYIVAHGSLKERHARKFARGIASALDYCHRNNVVHRDLKIENIMINEKGDVKIIDFGLSNLYAPKHLLKTYCGSLYFAAPELLSAKPYIGPEVDIWSFGVVLYVLVCGKVPFDDQSVSVLHEKIKKGNVEYPNFLSRECISLLSRMLVVDPARRATLYEICSHPWLNKGYDHKVSNYLPRREPLRLPLDPDVIKQIAAFDLGSVQSVTEELTALLTSVEYQMSCENWLHVMRQGKEYASAPNANILPDPTGGFHPLISIYYLVVEMKKRKKAKEDAFKAQLAQQEQQRLLQEQQRQMQLEQVYAPYPTPQEDDSNINSIKSKTQQAQQAQQPQQPQKPQPQPQLQTVAKPSAEPETPKPPSSTEVATQVPILGQYNPSKNSEPNTPQPKLVDTFAQNTPSKTLDPKMDQRRSASIAGTPPVVITVPEQAHTSSPLPPGFSASETDTSDKQDLILPEQQYQPHSNSNRSSPPSETLDPKHIGSPGSTTASTGFNNLFRKLSTKKLKGSANNSPKISATPSYEKDHLLPEAPNSKNDPLVRRGISMKVTAKEKEAAALRHSPIRSEKPRDRKPVGGTGGHSRTPSNGIQGKGHGFTPVEYMPPLPQYDPSTNTLIHEPSKQQSLAVPSKQLHPTARAKSVGGQFRRDAYTRARSNTANQPGEGVSGVQGEGALDQPEDSGLVFFDDIKLDDYQMPEIPQMTEDEVMRQYNNAKPGTMPSIEHCKTLFLKGFFSVQTTSAKPLPVIRYIIINVLSKLGVRFQEVKGGFVCIHTPSVQQPQDEADEILDAYAGFDETDEEKNLYGDAFKSKSKSSTLRSSSFDEEKQIEGSQTPTRKPSLHLQTGLLSPSAGPGGKSQHRSSNSIGGGSISGGGGGGGHRRKISIGNTFLNSYRKKNGSQVNMPPNTPATAKTTRGLYDEEFNIGTSHLDNDVDFEGDAFDYGNSAESLSGYGGGSDMLVSSRIEHRAHGSVGGSSHHRTASTSSGKSTGKSPLKFEIHIVKVPLVGLYGVQFKKIMGNTWNYKALANQILSEMNL